MSKLKKRVKSWLVQLYGNKKSSCPNTSGKYDESTRSSRSSPENSSSVIPRELISMNALKVLQRLNDHGYQAYLVGGCIRDLLLGFHPKDFDVATNAHPEEIRRLFRNSRMIGRRFKLVHILFGRETIEVATFRASHVEDKSQKHAMQDKNGRILRDNVYGTIEDDAARRDFTVNALYYSDEHCAGHYPEIVDFSDGLKDLQNKTLRLLGDPETRYREDPVRMLRAARFAAKLDFSIEPATKSPVHQLAHLLAGIPAARLFDESLKLFLNGNGFNTLHILQDLQLFPYLFPDASRLMLQNQQAQQLSEAALKSTDQRVEEGRPVTPAFLFAALLWHPVRYRAKGLQEKGLHMAQAMQEAANEVIHTQCQITAIPKRFSFAMLDIWKLQHHLVKHHRKKVASIASQPRFRAAYDFLLLREASGEHLDEAGVWWTQYQEKHPVITKQANGSGQTYHKHFRRKKRPSGMVARNVKTK